VNSVSPGMIPKISTKSLPFLRMENINNALKSCRELGVGTEDLFEMRDVFEERAVRNVQTTQQFVTIMICILAGCSLYSCIEED
jgi:hypothetical protein